MLLNPNSLNILDYHISASSRVSGIHLTTFEKAHFHNITFLCLYIEYDRGLLDYTSFQVNKFVILNRSLCIQGSADKSKTEEGV